MFDMFFVCGLFERIWEASGEWQNDFYITSRHGDGRNKQCLKKPIKSHPMSVPFWR